MPDAGANQHGTRREPAVTNHTSSSAEKRLRPNANPGYKTRRWVVERSHSWFNRFRKLLVSFEKTEASYTVDTG